MNTKPPIQAFILTIATLVQILVPHQQAGENSLAAEARPGSDTSIRQDAPALPVFFEANRGQADSDVKFVGRGNGFALLLKPTEAVIALRCKTDARTGSDARSSRFAMKLEGANPAPLVLGAEKQNGRVNYLTGSDESKWVRDVETYSSVLYAMVYPGIDLKFHTNDRRLEYDFNVSPGADPRAIRLRFDGDGEVQLASDGALVIRTPAGDLRQEPPVAFQDDNGRRVEVAAGFQRLPDGAIGFKVEGYDPMKPLVIDPTLVYSSYLGGTLADSCKALVVDPSGTGILFAGDSFSSNFLSHAGPGNSDVFVGKLTVNGGAFVYTFFGGNANETATGLAIDSAGNVYVSGTTESADFPKLHSLGAALAGPSDAFVTGLNSAFNAFLYSSLVGGTGRETGVSVAVDASGSAYLTGRTTSMDFPTLGAIQAAYGGGDSDAFVTKLSQLGDALVYSTYLGGGGTEDSLERTKIRLDSSGNVFVVGDTQSVNFPTKNALRGAKTGAAGTFDGFIAKINPSGSDFVFSTYIGGSEDDFTTDVAIDQSGNSFLTGRTRSTSFTGSSATRPSTVLPDAFAMKLNAAGSAVTYLTFVGGPTGEDSSNAIAVDASGSAVIAGSAGDGFPALKSIQSFLKGGLSDAFVTRLGPTGAINFSTYLGGSDDDVANGVGVDSDGQIYVAGFTDSTDFLVFSSLRGENAGGRDMFFARIDPDLSPDRPALIQAIISGKQLIIFGQGFDDGAKLRINDVQTKTRNGDPDPHQVLVARKGAKQIAPGQTVQLQVVNPDGKRSNLIFLTKPL